MNQTGKVQLYTHILPHSLNASNDWTRIQIALSQLNSYSG